MPYLSLYNKNRGIGVWFPLIARDRSLLQSRQNGSGLHTQQPIQYVPEAPYKGQRYRGVKLTAYLHLMQKLEMVRDIQPLHQYLDNIVLNSEQKYIYY